MRCLAAQVRSTPSRDTVLKGGTQRAPGGSWSPLADQAALPAPPWKSQSQQSLLEYSDGCEELKSSPFPQRERSGERPSFPLPCERG